MNKRPNLKFQLATKMAAESERKKARPFMGIQPHPPPLQGHKRSPMPTRTHTRLFASILSPTGGKEPTLCIRLYIKRKKE